VVTFGLRRGTHLSAVVTCSGPFQDEARDLVPLQNSFLTRGGYAFQALGTLACPHVASHTALPPSSPCHCLAPRRRDQLAWEGPLWAATRGWCGCCSSTRPTPAQQRRSASSQNRLTAILSWLQCCQPFKPSSTAKDYIFIIFQSFMHVRLLDSMCTLTCRVCAHYFGLDGAHF
jgi:hypothetical protein